MSSSLQVASVVLMGPALDAVSGVSTHIKQLSGSELKKSIRFLHFQVGSEGRAATSLLRVYRLLVDPVAFGLFLFRNRPDIVHINTSLVPKSYWRDLLYLLVARLLRRKVVYQVHGGALPEEFFAASALLRALLRRILKSVDVVVLLAQIELQAYRAFVPEVCLAVVPNGIDPSSLAREPLGSKAHGPLQLAYLGRLVSDKGVFDALKAMAMLAGEGREMHFTIAGSGPDEALLRAMSLQLNLTDRVHFAGPLFGEAKEELWRSAHVFVFPTYHEGLPYALLEAMAAGAVPVTTRVGAIPDVLTNGLHGLLVDAMDPVGLAAALRRLDDDRESLARMAEAGRDRILMHYSVARLADDFRRLYFGLLAKG